MPANKTLLFWSGGKDSALALYYLLKDEQFKVERLITHVSVPLNRICMHGVRSTLLIKQWESVGLQGEIIELPEKSDNQTYERITCEKLKKLVEEGFTHVAFGDIFLEDLRNYRKTIFEPLGVQCVFPLWNFNTHQVLREIISLGFGVVTVSINADVFDMNFIGRVIDDEFIKDFPTGADPCGENGEYHTFCFKGPYFKKTIDYIKGDIVLKNYSTGTTTQNFWFCDLLEA
ncbi:MAG: ATP-binding protein [Chitinophagales bacterium]|nr:ATP-binding protein [Chitinophagales bacterium]